MWSTTEQKHDDIAGAGRQTVEAAKETVKRPFEKAGEFVEEQEEYGRQGQQGSGGTTEVQQGGGGVFNAIGETIVEIGKTTKDLLIGKGQSQVTETVKESSEYDK